MRESAEDKYYLVSAFIKYCQVESHALIYKQMESNITWLIVGSAIGFVTYFLSPLTSDMDGVPAGCLLLIMIFSIAAKRDNKSKISRCDAELTYLSEEKKNGFYVTSQRYGDEQIYILPAEDALRSILRD